MEWDGIEDDTSIVVMIDDDYYVVLLLFSDDNNYFVLIFGIVPYRRLRTRTWCGIEIRELYVMHNIQDRKKKNKFFRVISLGWCLPWARRLVRYEYELRYDEP